MKKPSSALMNVLWLLSLIAPLALANATSIPASSVAEPIYLSICGIFLLAFGLMGGKPSEQ